MNQHHQEKLLKEIKGFSIEISTCELRQKVEIINSIRKIIHEISPFKSEPVDFVEWVENEIVIGNEYNPNIVMPVEMALLKLSIQADGYTQPIVSFKNNEKREVVDGFHRHKVGKYDNEIQTRVLGYLPVVTINSDREDITDRMAATIRHNKARGKHQISAMSDIVMDLKKRNWNDAKISKHLGMDQDEVSRLCVITGLASLFIDREFSQAWEPEITEEDV